jgi:hypothetical protein
MHRSVSIQSLVKIENVGVNFFGLHEAVVSAWGFS